MTNGAGASLNRPWPTSTTVDNRGNLRFHNNSASELVTTYGSPLIIFDEDEFRTSTREIADAFRGFTIYYAAKSFLSGRVCQLVNEAGLSIDVCTEGELRTVLGAEFSARNVLFHGNNKSASEISFAMTHGVKRYASDTLEDLARLETAAHQTGVGDVNVLLRVIADVKSDTHRHISTAHQDQKFGFSVRDEQHGLGEAIRFVNRSDVLNLTGLHSHIGSQILNQDNFIQGAETAVNLYADLRRSVAPTLCELDLGGGFGIAYHDDEQDLDLVLLAQTLVSVVTDNCVSRGVPPPQLSVEPGRAISGRSCVTIYTVGSVKKAESGRTYVAVDGGMSDNVRTALYDAKYTARLANRAGDSQTVDSRVVGKHCDAGDIVVSNVLLPSDIKADDLLAVPATGAYCRSLSSTYNMLPRPPIVAIRNGDPVVTIRRETYDDLTLLDCELRGTAL